MPEAAASEGGVDAPAVLYHLVQQSLWEKAVAGDETYYPPTYQQVRLGTYLYVGYGSALMVDADLNERRTHRITDTGRLHPRDGRPQVPAWRGQPLLHGWVMKGGREECGR